MVEAIPHRLPKASALVKKQEVCGRQPLAFADGKRQYPERAAHRTTLRRSLDSIRVAMPGEGVNPGIL
jgi:hypothetical protein